MNGSGGSALAGIELHISQHAMWQAAERFPHFDTTSIEAEIAQAFNAGRASHQQPPGCRRGHPNRGLYCWTADGARVYVLRIDRYNHARFVVITTLRAQPAQES